MSRLTRSQRRRCTWRRWRRPAVAADSWLNERGQCVAKSPKESNVRRIKGPAVFLAQFLRDEEPFNSLAGLGKWFAGLGYKGVQIPAWDRCVIDLDQAAASRSY